MRIWFFIFLLAENQVIADPTPVEKKQFKKIMDEYVLVGDLLPKEETRSLPSSEPFWRYPMPIPKISFDYDYQPPKGVSWSEYIPQTIGSGRAIEHLNRGRVLFLDNNFQEANATWLSGIARYGKEYEYHRRNDFFVAISFFRLLESVKKEDVFRNKINNASTFLSKAFKLKSDLKDHALDPYVPKFLYVLASIYFNYEKFVRAFDVAQEGISLQKKSGRLAYRPKFRRILAESFVRNRSYLGAMQQYDIALREGGVSARDAAAMFARIADIYFDLNNFELAEDIYNIAIILDKEGDYIRPSQFVLRGESLFWMKRFSLAQRMFHYALNVSGKSIDPLPNQMAAVASIRTADAWLVQVDFSKVENLRQSLKNLKTRFSKMQRGTPEYIEAKGKINQLSLEAEKYSLPLVKARIAYSRHIVSFPEDHTADHARIRLACLDLPQYLGNNIRHARDLLENLKFGMRGIDPGLKPAKDEDMNQKQKGKSPESADAGSEKKDAAQKNNENPTPPDATNKGAKWAFDMEKKQREYKSGSRYPALPEAAIHLAWGCQTASYAQHERNQSMVEKVRKFSNLYPRSRFLRPMRSALVESQSKLLYRYISESQIYKAISFFEKNRKVLFQKVPISLRVKLFRMYVDTYKAEKASEFLPDFLRIRGLKGLDLMRLGVYAAEMANMTPANKKFSQEVGKRLLKHNWTLPQSEVARMYMDRVKESSGLFEHRLWILSLANDWAKNDAKIICEIQYPILSDYWRDKPSSREWVKKETENMLKKYLTELLQFETFCGYSLLEFEYSLFSDNPSYLAERYKERDFLLVNRVTANLIWNLSELLFDIGDISGARKLWEKLDSSGEDRLKEVQYARSRLDTRKTELDNLWE